MNFAIFGDSIACGLNDKKNGGWVSLLDRYVRSLDKGILYNLSIDGETSKGILGRLEGEIKLREIAKTIIAIGINDSLYRSEKNKIETPIEDFSNNIKNIINKTAFLKQELVFVGLTSVNEKLTKPFTYSTTGKCYDNSLIQTYNDKIMFLCKEFNTPFINIINLLEINDLDDGVHPNSSGHQKLFTKIKQDLISLNFFNDRM